MKKLEYKIDIAATPKKVWDTMLNADTYKEWTSVSWPDSFYEGTWKKGETLRFISHDQSGTMARIEEFNPYEFLLANHIAILNKGVEDRDSDMAKGWVGTTESYHFTEKNGKTHLTVEIITNPAWESMFNDGWPKALAKLKEISEM